jgi:arylsulfatase A-like enzyme
MLLPHSSRIVSGALLPRARSQSPIGDATRLLGWLIVPLLALCLASAAASAASGPPNVIVILTDDQGWGDLSVNGNVNLATPHIDALARGGASFERFFVSPVCSPTRAEFLTGRYHPRSGVRGVSTGQERMNLDERTLADALKAAGYATGLFGKWHNGSQWPYHPNARGFDEFYGFTSGHWGEYFDPPLEHNGRPGRGEGYIADDLTNSALDFIAQHRARPFLCTLALNTPHSPFCVPDAYWDRFKAKPLALRGDSRRENMDATRCTLAMCENIDANVGRVLRRLDELKLSENTIVIYFSDNGPNGARWNGGMKGIKGSVDEGGLRVPFFIRWPGRIEAGKIVREIAGAIDLLPTLAALTGAPLPSAKPLDGRDLSPLLRSDPPGGSWPDRMIFSHFAGRTGVRTQRYRLDDRGALFDMERDPGQTADIAGQHPEIAARLRDAVAEWKTEMLPREKDDRPLPVGFAEFPMTPLPARDGVPRGGIRRSAAAPNCSYFVNWTSPDDAMTWDVEVQTAGEYEATIHYTCPEADAGSTVELSLNGSTLRGKVAPGWDPPLIADQDRVPRKGESLMKEFRPLALGPIRLEKGRGLLTLRAVEIPGRSVMDVRLVTLTLTSPAP